MTIPGGGRGLAPSSGGFWGAVSGGARKQPLLGHRFRAGLVKQLDVHFMAWFGQVDSTVSEAMFHDELEKRLRADPELGGRLTRRDPVAGGFDESPPRRRDRRAEGRPGQAGYH
jgi:hypothetical protein